MSLKAILKFILFRILQAIPLLFGIILIVFVLIQAAPGDPVTVMLGPNPVSEEYIQQVRHDLGLDRPVHIQLVTYIWNVLHGDFGTSYAYRLPVFDVVISRIPPTLLLMGSAYLLASVFGITMGIIAARHPGSWLDNILMILSVVGYSVPAFWTAFVAILLFSIKLDWFPVGGMMNVRLAATGLPRIYDILHHMVLPTLVLTFFFMTLITRLTRSSMLEVLHSDYITQARSKGLSETRVILRHAFPNALIPVITVLGLQFGNLLSGAVLTEMVFAWPGIGRLMVEAVGRRDFPLLIGIFIISSSLIIVVSLLTDLVYALVNPKIRVSN